MALEGNDMSPVDTHCQIEARDIHDDHISPVLFQCGFRLFRSHDLHRPAREDPNGDIRVQCLLHGIEQRLCKTFDVLKYSPLHVFLSVHHHFITHFQFLLWIFILHK